MDCTVFNMASFVLELLSTPLQHLAFESSQRGTSTCVTKDPKKLVFTHWSALSQAFRNVSVLVTETKTL